MTKIKQFKDLLRITSVTIVLVFVGAGQATIAYALSPGTTGTWQATSSLPDNLAYSASATYDGYMYVLGGTDGSGVVNTAYYASINSDGTAGTWHATTTLLDNLSSSTAVASNGYVYLIGGQDNSGLVSSVYYAAIKSGGTLGAWHTTTSVPDVWGGATSFIYNGYVYTFGGVDNFGAPATVYSAPIKTSGALGTWSASSHSLPSQIQDLSSVVYGGHVYSFGGYINSDAGTGFADSVYSATLGKDGTVGSWRTDTNLPVGFGYSTAAVYNGYAFVLGGLNNSGVINSVYSTPLNSNGAVGSWSTATNIPVTLFGSTSITYAGNVYEIGGNSFGFSSPDYVNTVYSANLTGFSSPVLSSQNARVISGSSVTVDVLAGATGNFSSSSLEIVSGPAHGSATDPPGTITYTPDKGYVGADSLVYQVCSADDGSLCTRATLTFDVLADSAAGAPDTGYGSSSTATPLLTLGLGGFAFCAVASGVWLRKLLDTKPKGS